MNYSDQFKSPKWQIKRLKIMARDGFQCQFCFSKEKTLNAHHEYYKKGKSVWDYPDSALVTLCKECHSKNHHSDMSQARYISEMINNHDFPGNEENIRKMMEELIHCLAHEDSGGLDILQNKLFNGTYTKVVNDE
jgi:hypothetical protein